MADENDSPGAFNLGNIDAADLPMRSDEAKNFAAEGESPFPEESLPDAEEPKPAATPKEEPKPAVEPPKPKEEGKPAEQAPEAKAGQEKKVEEKKDDEVDADLKAELDAIKIKANTPEKIKSDIAKVRAIAERERKAVKVERARLAEIQAKLEAAEKIPKVDETLQSKIKELEEFRAKIQFSDDRELNAEYDKKTEEAQGGIFNLLKTAGLPDESAAEMKKNGLGSYSAQWWKANILDKVGPVDPFLARNIEDAVLKWRSVGTEREAKKQEFVANREQIHKQSEEKAVGWWKDWGSKVEGLTVKLSKEHPWTQAKEIPATATPEQKAEIEAWNKDLDAKKNQFADTVNKLASVDADTVANVTFKAFHADQLMTEKENLKKDLESANQRITQLEEDAAKRNQAGRNSHRQTIAVAKDGKRKNDHSEGPIDLDEAWKEAGLED